jgi:hypothetical protein
MVNQDFVISLFRPFVISGFNDEIWGLIASTYSYIYYLLLGVDTESAFTTFFWVDASLASSRFNHP